MKKFFIKILLLVLIIFPLTFGCGHTMTDNERAAQKYFEQANSEWMSNRHNRQRVIENYTSAIELNPNLADAYIGRSVIYQIESRTVGTPEDQVKARQDCERALKADPNSARAYRWRAYLNRYKDVTSALADANRAVELDPNYLEAYEMRANIYMDMKYYSRAIADYTYILEYPNFKNSSYMKYYDFDRMSDWQWYVNWDQRIAALYNLRGNAYYYNGDIDNAINDYECALKLSPNNMWIGRPFGGKIQQIIAEKNSRNG